MSGAKYVGAFNLLILINKNIIYNAGLYKITDEIFHDEVQKEIGRRQTMEENRQQRTAADLRGNIPTTLPEMAAQQRVEQSNEPEFVDSN